MRPRILQVITDTDRRGAQVFAVDLHEFLERTGRSVRTLALARGNIGGIDVEPLGSRRLALRTLRALRREIRAADVVVAHGSSTLPACAIASMGTGTPFIYRQISESLFWAPSRWRRARVRLGLARAACVVALFPGAAETLQAHFGVASERIRIIPNGVVPARFPAVDRTAVGARRASFGLDAGMPTVAYLGALVPEKGVDIVIDAMARLVQFQLLVVGDGPERKGLEAQARRVAPGRVVFAGSVPDPNVVFEAADVLVLASRGGDSMPGVLIEAGLAQLPTIATPVQGIPEIVVDGETGHIVPVGSSDALSDAIERVLSDPAHARRLGENARRHCLDRFAIEPVGARWDEVLNEVVGGDRVR